jgi:hypothetical protein
MFDADTGADLSPPSASTPHASNSSEPELSDPDSVEPYSPGSSGQDSPATNDAEMSLEAAQKDADKNFPSTPVDAVSSPCGKPPSSRPPNDPSSQKTWIEYQLVDDKGKAVPDVRYRVKSTDGSMIDGVFDKLGKARIASLDPGNCKIWLLDVDGKEWKKG